MIASAPRWYCLRSRSKREHVAAQLLSERTGFEVFAPCLAARRARRDGSIALSAEALFPGYLFARFFYPEQWRFVCSTQEITGIVHFGDHTPPIADELIAFLREQVTTAHATTPVLAEGDWVEVLTGCLAGTEGRVVTFDSAKARAWVLLSLLGQDLRISLPAELLRRGGPRNAEVPPQLLAGCG